MFYLATDNASEIRAQIQRWPELDSPNLSIEVHASSDPPKQLGARLAWHLDGTLNMLSPKKAKPPGASPTLQLADFNWPWAVEKFTETVSQFQPDSIIIEYVKLAYLIDDLGKQLKSVQTIIDTHDMLHKRCLLYTSPSPRDATLSRMPSSA